MKILPILITLLLLPTVCFAQSEIVPINTKLECRWQLNSGPELYSNNNGLITRQSFDTFLRKNTRKTRKLRGEKKNAETRKDKRRFGKKLKKNKELGDTVRECQGGSLDGLCCTSCVSPTC